MIEDNANRLLMSDSIKGMVPELEEERIDDISTSFVVAAMEMMYEFDSSHDVIAGKVVGLSLETINEVKLDIRIELEKAYQLVKKYSSSGLSCRMLYLHLGDDEICFEGDFRIASPKMLDFDHQNKMCTLGIDLIKI